ncbi:MAG: hypothetical protein K6T85_11030 [Gorillibacterium sp.]|nr:hypothetical protein [Gorillibacterium sp.]
MNKKWTYITATLTIATAVFIGSSLTQTTQADSAVPPGSADDPVVTKSYVDEQIRNVGGGSGNGEAAAGIVVVTLTKGQTLVANASTEFILRVGEAKAMSKDGNGIPDVTLGKDIANGAPISKNSLLIFPSDGRGITALSNQAIVMVRGGYTVK